MVCATNIERKKPSASAAHQIRPLHGTRMFTTCLSAHCKYHGHTRRALGACLSMAPEDTTRDPACDPRHSRDRKTRRAQHPHGRAHEEHTRTTKKADAQAPQARLPRPQSSSPLIRPTMSLPPCPRPLTTSTIFPIGRFRKANRAPQDMRMTLQRPPARIIVSPLPIDATRRPSPTRRRKGGTPHPCRRHREWADARTTRSRYSAYASPLGDATSHPQLQRRMKAPRAALGSTSRRRERRSVREYLQ
ncbi:hypothetical protein C8J57DRAFT_1710488 [Mycena rebaudengoi]|nr:hypothetical protein C8J57DRAFT_1710488 [Mycena rebaudengoi]